MEVLHRKPATRLFPLTIASNLPESLLGNESKVLIWCQARRYPVSAGTPDASPRAQNPPNPGSAFKPRPLWQHWGFDPALGRRMSPVDRDLVPDLSLRALMLGIRHTLNTGAKLHAPRAPPVAENKNWTSTKKNSPKFLGRDLRTTTMMMMFMTIIY